MQELARLNPNLNAYTREALADYVRRYMEDPFIQWLDVRLESGSFESIGFLIISSGEERLPNTDIYIQEAFILPEHRRRGIMSAAVSELLRDHPGHSISMHVLNANIYAMRFWLRLFRRLGYTFTQEPDADCGEMSRFIFSPIRTEHRIVNGTYTWEWAGGQTLTVPCRVDLDTRRMFDCAPADCVVDLDLPEREYITLDGTDYPISRYGGTEYWYN